MQEMTWVFSGRSGISVAQAMEAAAQFLLGRRILVVSGTEQEAQDSQRAVTAIMRKIRDASPETLPAWRISEERGRINALHPAGGMILFLSPAMVRRAEGQRFDCMLATGDFPDRRQIEVLYLGHWRRRGP